MKTPPAHIPSILTSNRLLLLQIITSCFLITGITFCRHSEVHAKPVDIAVETFTAQSWDSGTGWRYAWYHEGSAHIIPTDGPHSASHHLCLRAGDAWVDRPLDLSPYNNARLGLYVKVHSFEGDDYAELKVQSGNSDWQTVRRFTASDSNSRYQYYEFDLGPYGSSSNVQIGFEAEMSGEDDFLYVDDIRVFTDATPPVQPNADPIFGVTIDDISNAGAMKDSLSSLARRPTARVVFDVSEECGVCVECEECEGVEPSYYKKTLADLHTVTDIMGEIVDSFFVKGFTLAAYEERTRDYVNAMADEVDIWEVGNEINGEWLKDGAIDKAEAAYNIVKAAGEPAALTLYYNGTYDNGQATTNNCWSFPEEQMQVWAQKNVPEHMKQGLDYVFVSFYEEHCLYISPDWDEIFSDLHAIFPNSILGFGEVGSESPNERAKETILRRYYGMNRLRPEFAGGFFWWYFKQDMVPKGTAESPNFLWDTLNEYAESWDEQYD